MRVPGSGEVVWQLEHPVSDVVDADPVAAARVLAALGHPLRLEIVRRLWAGADARRDRDGG